MKANDMVPAFFQVEHATHGEAIMGLTAVRAGLYDALKLMYWRNHCALPFGKDEIVKLKRRIPLTGYEDEDLVEVLDEYFPDGHHADLDKQRWGIDQTRSQAREAANKRWASKKVTNGGSEVPPQESPSSMFDQPTSDNAADF